MKQTSMQGNATMDAKSVMSVDNAVYSDESAVQIDAHGGTDADRLDMARVGRDQVMNRNFRFISVVGFTAVLMSTWESVLSTSSFGLTDGGVSGMIYTYIGGVSGFSTVVLSMAEMASMAPTSGGQYHWVSEFAPPSTQKFLSYMVGWVCVLGWHSAICGANLTVAQMLQGMITLNDASYVPKGWHVTLFVIACCAVAIIFNTFLYQKMPVIEGIVLVIHVFGFFGIMIPLWVLAPHPSNSQVWANVEDNGQWGNKGLACLIGLTAPLFALIGPDSAVHMSEEIKDASRVLPKAMVSTLLINSIGGLVMVITFGYCIPDAQAAANSNYAFPFMYVFLQATGSAKAATGMTAVLTCMSLCAAISGVATTSRQTFAFARDGGIPFSSWFAHIHPRFVVPLNSLMVTFTIVSLLSLICIGSTVAFNAITSLATASLLSSYIVSTGCVVYRRFRGMPLPQARWSLGKLAGPIDFFALLFLIIAWFFTFWPTPNHPSPADMNWASPIFGGVVIAALIYYAAYGRHNYEGPVTRVKQVDVMQ